VTARSEMLFHRMNALDSFWVEMLSATSAKASATLGELARLDVADFFHLLAAAQKQAKRKL